MRTKKVEKVIIWDGDEDYSEEKGIPYEKGDRVEILCDKEDENGLIPVVKLNDKGQRLHVYALVCMNDLREADKFKAWPTANGVMLRFNDRGQTEFHVKAEFVPQAIKVLKDFLKSQSKGK